MKMIQKSLLACTALIGFAVAAPATVIVDNTWPSGVYTNWNLPLESPWYYNSSTTNLYMGAVTNALILTNYDEASPTLVTGTRYFWTYFTTNATDLTLPLSYTNPISGDTNAVYGYPVDFEVGQMLTVTLTFSPSGVIVDSGTKGLRFGLMSYGTNTPQGRADRSTANISKSGTNVSGYSVELPLFANLTNNNMFSFRVRTNLSGISDSIDPLGKNTVFSSLGGGPSLTNVAGFLADSNYTFQFSISRYPTANMVSANISGPLAGVAQTNFSRAYMDTSGSNYFQFDAFLMRVDSSSLVADQLILKEFKVETTQLPPFSITSASFIDPNDFKLVWTSLSGQKYRIDSKSDLGAASWTSNDTVVATGNTTSWTNSGVGSISQQFYRVVNTP